MNNCKIISNHNGSHYRARATNVVVLPFEVQDGEEFPLRSPGAVLESQGCRDGQGAGVGSFWNYARSPKPVILCHIHYSCMSFILHVLHCAYTFLYVSAFWAPFFQDLLIFGERWKHHEASQGLLKFGLKKTRLGRVEMFVFVLRVASSPSNWRKEFEGLEDF